MIHPSYVELMQVVNEGADVGEEPVVNSRYSIVCATAKRARQIIDGKEPMIDYDYGDKPLSVAVDELYDGSLRILTDEEAAEKQAEVDKAKEILRQRRAEAERIAAEKQAAEEAAAEENAEEETAETKEEVGEE
ncbi:MAG: DNA-directed RNA polymerase subunit omega [Lachnospiraceae bacterium]|nr:DNA-directed RNA polymerase subunit omega [Lachnospiraceae bacterium]